VHSQRFDLVLLRDGRQRLVSGVERDPLADLGQRQRSPAALDPQVLAPACPRLSMPLLPVKPVGELCGQRALADSGAALDRQEPLAGADLILGLSPRRVRGSRTP